MSIAVLGEALIDFIEGEDGRFRPHLGGSPYNVAIGLARQGIKVSYLSPLSNDAFGEQLHDSLELEKVNLPLPRRSNYPTSLALVVIDAQYGTPAYRFYRDGVADKDTSFDEIRACLPPDLLVFHTGSLALTPSQLPTIRPLLELMRSSGVVTSLDLNIRLGASRDTAAYLKGVRSLLPLADIVKASDEDLEPLQLAPNPRDAAKVAHQEMGRGLLILTEGSGGARLHTANDSIELGPDRVGGKNERHTEDDIIKASAWPVTQVADTVGAGDTFHSAFLAALHRSQVTPDSLATMDRILLEDAIEFACAAAAINVSRRGCDPPTRNEVDQFRKSKLLKWRRTGHLNSVQ